MQGILKRATYSVSGVAIAVALGLALLSYGAPNPLGNPLFSWAHGLFRTQSFVPVSAENQPLSPSPLTTSLRALDTETPRSATGAALETLIENQGGSDFPVLVPYGFADTLQSVAASRLRLRLLDNGYYTVFQSQTMEVTIVATRTVWSEGETPQDGVQNTSRGNYVMPFEDPGPIPAGGAITFGHFGADYSVSFDCVDTSPGQRRNCITENAALDFVANLVAGTPTALRLPALVSS